jgi:aspartyl-tRNA(Asn)/glutamyl-tRNA(Gln) amidotransferase subunit C
MKITREEVLRVAELARLELSEAEVELFVRQLSEILEYVDLLGRVDVEGVEPTAHVLAISAPLRADEPHPSLPLEEALSSAPARAGSSFLVPKVLDA